MKKTVFSFPYIAIETSVTVNSIIFMVLYFTSFASSLITLKYHIS